MTAAPARAAAMLAPLRLPAFRLQFSAAAIAVVGSTLSPVALALGVLELTGSAKSLGLVLAANTIPLVIFMLIGGVWADRLPRNRIMSASHAVCAVSQTALGVMMVTGRFSLPAALALQFVSGTAMAFYFPSVSGLTALLVPSAILQKANALLSLTRSIGGSIGPLLAGLAVAQVSAGWAIIAEGCCFLISAACLTRLSGDVAAAVARSGPARPRTPFIRDLVGGFREVVSRPWVWSSIGAFMLSHLATAFFLVLTPALLLARGEPPLAWGGVIASLSIGQLLGDVIALRVTPHRPIVAARLVELLSVPLLLALALGAPVWVLVAAAVLAGVALTFPDALWYTAMQQHLPGDTLSRVSSYDWLGSLSLRPIGFVAAAWLADLVGVATTLAAAAVLVVASRLAGLLPRDVQQLTSAPPAEPATPAVPTTPQEVAA